MKINFFQCSAPSFLQPPIIAAPCSRTNIQIFFASSFFWKFIWIEKHKMAKNVLTLKTRRKRKTNQIPMKGFLFERYQEFFGNSSDWWSTEQVFSWVAFEWKCLPWFLRNLESVPLLAVEGLGHQLKSATATEALFSPNFAY